MTSRAYALVSGTLFTLIALLHLVRLVRRVPVEIGGWPVPVWISGAALIVAGGLALWGLRLGTKRGG